MTTKRIGGTAAKTGFYWNLGKWEMSMVPKQGGILPGDSNERYLKVPVLALLVVAPLMGAVYAMFLPFIGFAMLFTFLGRKALAMGRSGAVDVAATLTPEWRPGEAYLASGKKKRELDPENGDVVDPESIDASVQGTQRTEPRRPDLHD
jgi:hypothetical protein